MRIFRKIKYKKGQKNTDFFSSLSKELVIHIFKLLDYQDLCRSAQLSKRFNTISENNALWSDLVLRVFKIEILVNPRANFAILTLDSKLKIYEEAMKREEKRFTDPDRLAEYLQILTDSKISDPELTIANAFGGYLFFENRCKETKKLLDYQNKVSSIKEKVSTIRNKIK